MEVICLEDEAFYSFCEQVFQRLKSKEKAKDDKWISAEEAMYKLRISSKTTHLCVGERFSEGFYDQYAIRVIQ